MSRGRRELRISSPIDETLVMPGWTLGLTSVYHPEQTASGCSGAIMPNICEQHGSDHMPP